jgi:hypothetical protein
MDENETFHIREFQQSDLEPLGESGDTLVKSETSSMPSYEAALTEDEKHCLLEFLDTLR